MKPRFFLANPRADRCSIDAIVSMNGQRYKKGIGMSIETKYWDGERQLSSVNQRYREGALINHALGQWSGAIDRAVRRMALENLDLNKKEFWELVDCEKSGKPYLKKRSDVKFLTDYFGAVFIPKFISTKSYSRTQRFKVVLSKLQDFETHKCRQYTFDEINISFYRDLQEYMNGLKHSANYFGTVIKIVKQVMKEAQIIDKLHNNNEFNHSDFKATTQEVDNVYLTMSELEKIHTTEIGVDFVEKFHAGAYPSAVRNIITSYNIVKNRFLIGAFTGLRMSDFNRVDSDSVHQGFITVITEKTDQKVIIPIHPIVKDIIDSGFDLSVSLSDAKTRAYIKQICKYVGLKDVVEVRKSVSGKITSMSFEKWQLVGTHTARRSFATNAYKAGVPTISIMKITGHTKESSFMRYIRISQEENAEILAKHRFFN